MIAIYIISSIVLVALSVGLSYGLFLKMNPPDAPSVPVTPETMESDMSLINRAIDSAICKALYYYVERDMAFSKDSPVKQFLRGHFRDLISFLLRNDITIDENLSNKQIVQHSFFDVFIRMVYMTYTSETSNSIKKLFFKYYSGYTSTNYPNPKDRKPDKPSIIFYIMEYATKFLYRAYYMKEKFENNYLSLLNGKDGADVESYEKMMAKYDSECVVKLILNTYNVNGVEVGDLFGTTEKKLENKEKK